MTAPASFYVKSFEKRVSLRQGVDISAPWPRRHPAWRGNAKGRIVALFPGVSGGGRRRDQHRCRMHTDHFPAPHRRFLPSFFRGDRGGRFFLRLPRFPLMLQLYLSQTGCRSIFFRAMREARGRSRTATAPPLDESASVRSFYLSAGSLYRMPGGVSR